MNSPKQNEEKAASDLQELKTENLVKFVVYASFEDFKSLENVIKDWKVKHNKTVRQIGIASELKGIPIIEIK